MPSFNSPFPLVVIVGPTAVGKTEVSIQLAEFLNGEIVSADSRLFYRGMDIGTAKPSKQDQHRVPHHLIDIANPDETWSLALFQKSAIEIIDVIHARGKLPFLVGGTGQYVRAVIEGWKLPPQQPNSRIREALEKIASEQGPFEFHNKLKRIDPVAAGFIDPTNVRRTIRAFEVIFLTGKLFSDQREKTKSKYSIHMIGLNRPRTELYRRIDDRIDAMIKSGLVNEVQSLLDKGYPPDLPSLSAIGYCQVIAFLEDKISLDEAILQIKRQTRQFVRRQANWFKENDPNITWFDVSKTPLEAIRKFVEQTID
jgi:tRNA dimethylallyltransferase